MKKQTDKALTGLQWALAQTPKPRRDDEFTAREFFLAGGASSNDSARCMLRRMVENGKLAQREVIEGGRRIAVYTRRPAG